LSFWRFESAIAHLSFHRFHLPEPRDIALAAVEAGAQERAHELRGEARPDHLGAEAEHVHVVVLDSLPCRVGVVAYRSADAAKLRGRDRGADARAADEDAALGVAAVEGVAELAR